MVSNTARTTVVALFTKLATVKSDVWTYYFEDSYSIGNDPFTTAGLVALFGAGFLAFLTAGLSETLAVAFILFGCVAFMGSVLLHLSLWVLGSFYRHGVLNSIATAVKMTAFIIYGLLAIAFLLYGSIIPAFGVGVLYAAVVPEPFASAFAPVLTICLMAFMVAWFVKGNAYLDLV